MKPLVSVVTPAYDAASVIARALGSVASQSLGEVEHIVVDDGSIDGTWELLQSWSASNAHLLPLRQRRQGAGAARNAGIEAARGRYIAFLDADDVWLARKLEVQIGFMEAQKCLFSYGDYRERDHSSSRVLAEFRMPKQLSHRDFLRGCPIGCLTVAYNQEVLGKAYMPRVARGQDWGLWLNLTRGGAVAMRYPGIEAEYFRGDSSLSSNKLRKLLDIYRIYREQEGLGPARSAGLLAVHSIASIRKRREAVRGGR